MATSELKIIISATDKASPSVKSLESSLGGLAKSVVSIYALKQGFDFLADSVKKAGKEEANLRTLQTVIENNGQAWSAVEKSLTSYIAKAEYNTMFTDEQIIPALTQLATFGFNASQSQNVLSSAMDLATAKGLDLQTSVTLLGKAYQGNTETLARYGIKAKDFNDLMGQVNSKFGGTAQQQMSTYEGNIHRLETSFDKLQKTIGTALVPSVNKFVLAMDTLLGGGKTPEVTGALKTLTEINEKHQLYVDILKGEKVLNREIIDGESVRINGVKVLIKDINDKAFLQKEIIRLTDEEKKAVIALGLEQKKQGDESKLSKQQEVEANDDYTTSLLDSEIWLNSQIEQAGKTLRANELEAEKVKNNELLQLAGASSQAITALGVATNSATLKGMGIVISGVQNAITAVNAMMTASGPVGFILGLLGFVTSAANTVSSLNQLAELENQNAALLETGNTGITTISNPETPRTTTSSSGVSSVERASAPTYYTFNSTYNINAGVMLGDEFTISETFKKLMANFDQQQKLTMSGA